MTSLRDLVEGLGGAVRSRLFRRYFIFIGGAISIVLLLAIAIETPLSYRDTLAGVGAVQLAGVRSAALQVDQFVSTVESAMRESAGIPWSKAPFGSADARAEHHRLMKLFPSIDSLQAVEADGALRLSVSRRDLDRPRNPLFENGELLRRARSQRAAIGTSVFQDGIEPVVDFAVAGDPRRNDFLVAQLNLRTVSDIVTQLRVGSTGRVFLADGSGRIVAHPDSANTMRKPSDAALALFAEIRRRLGSDGVALPFEARSGEGHSVLVTAVSLPRWNWMVVAEEPLEVALAPVRQTVIRLVALMVAGLLVALLFSAMLAKRLSGPIVSLREGADKIASGNLASRIDVRTGDEVEALARDFNAMAAQLEDYTTGLERKVDEKTVELQEALRVAREAMRARALFLAAASHDLRQPLYAISLFADALVEEEMSAEGVDTLEKQRRAIATLRTLFDNLLDLSRFDAGEIRPVLRNVSLREILVPVTQEFEMVCAAKGLRWKWSLVDVWVRTDPELLRRLARNLLSNAVRYTDHGEVQVAAVEREGRVCIQVIDTGIGIDPGDHARVFEEFVQLDNPARDREKGVGLGLSIVKRIGELIDARLRLESGHGTGTAISFELPVVPAEAPQAGITAHPQDIGSLAGLLVWVVEDDPSVQAGISKLLATWKVKCEIVASRAELIALRESKAPLPDAVILDDMLKDGEGGLEVAQWLRTFIDEACIVLVTGNVSDDRTRELEASGLVVLRKPLAASDIAQWLRDAAAISRPA